MLKIVKIDHINCFVFQILFVGFLCLWNTFTYGQSLAIGIEQHPPYDEVVEHFFEEYTGLESQEHYIEFARHPEGWFVQLKKYVDNTKATNIPFFVVGKGYIDLREYFQRGEGQSERFVNFRNWVTGYQSMRMFAIHSFYGYQGWGDDIIKVLEPQLEQLNDADLYSLARAYSAVAMGVVSNDRGASILPPIKFHPEGNSMDEEALSQYLSLNLKAVGYFKMLTDRSPTYKTIVGTIRTKYANEVMQGYLDLFIYQNSKTAEERVLEGIYTDDILANAHNILSNCPQNSIFISFGDNDFYPLIYTQLKEGFRKDVLVVNYSLLGLPNYIAAIQREYNLKMSIGPSVYQNLDVVVQNPIGATINWEELKEKFETESSSQLSLDCSTIGIYRNGDTAQLSHTKYLYKHHLALIDLFISNSERPYCSSSTGDPMDIFINHMVSLGRVFEVRLNKAGIDFEESLAYFQTVSAKAYSDVRLMIKDERGEFIDPIPVRTLYHQIIFTICDAKYQHPGSFEELKEIFERWRKHWIIQPSEDDLTAYENCIRS